MFGPNGFSGVAQQKTYFRIGLVLAIPKVVFPDLGFSIVGFRGLFSIGEKGLVRFNSNPVSDCLDEVSQLLFGCIKCLLWTNECLTNY